LKRDFAAWRHEASALCLLIFDFASTAESYRTNGKLGWEIKQFLSDAVGYHSFCIRLWGEL